MTDRKKRSALTIGLRAFGLGVVAAIVLPFILMFTTLWLSHKSGGCGAGSSGGCEMGAAALGFATILPSFAIGVLVSLFRDLPRR